MLGPNLFSLGCLRSPFGSIDRWRLPPKIPKILKICLERKPLAGKVRGSSRLLMFFYQDIGKGDVQASAMRRIL